MKNVMNLCHFWTKCLSKDAIFIYYKNRLYCDNIEIFHNKHVKKSIFFVYTNSKDIKQLFNWWS